MIVNTVIWTAIWGGLGIVGVLLAISKIGFKKAVDWRIGIGLTLAAISLFALAIGLPQYGIGFSIIGTLIIAGAALMAIKQSEKKAGIDRRERKLIDIITWANDIVRCETAGPYTPISALDLHKALPELRQEQIEAIFKSHESSTKVNLIMRYQNLDVVRPRIVLMSKQLDKELGSNLELLAQQTGEKLEEHVDLGAKYIRGEMSEDDYRKRWESLRDSATALAEKAEEMI
jgi:hypothetical protein